MKRDYLAWAALVAALVVTASAEYSLARECGFGQWMAAGVPAALDVYAVRALRVHKDVLAVVVAMIAVNAASHLVTAGLLPVNVPLVVAVSAIAPLVLWRVHALRNAAAAVTETTTPATTDVTTETTTGPASLPRLVPVPFEVPIVPELAPVPLPTAAVPAAKTTNLVVTSPVGDPTGDMTPGQRKRAARRLNRDHIRRSGKPVTVDQLRTEYGLSRRDAAALRREVLDTDRQTPDDDHEIGTETGTHHDTEGS